MATCSIACGGQATTPPAAPLTATASEPDWRSQLEFLAGNWTFDGTISGEPLQFVETCEWIPGGYHLQCYTGSTADGFSLIGHQYGVGFTHYNFTPKSAPRVVTGTFDGSAWRFAGSYVKDGKPHQTRVTMTMASRDQFSFLYEISAAGQPWKVFLNGTYRRATTPSPAPTP